NKFQFEKMPVDATHPLSEKDGKNSPAIERFRILQFN
ncbi:unnamed protein product, partial [marine sediment metagenome]